LSLQIGSGTNDCSKLQTSQGTSDEPVACEEIDTYHSTSHDKINESNMKEANIPHNGIANEVERNTFRGSSDIFSNNPMPTNASFATFPTLTMSDRVPSGNVHSLDIATARDFFDNFSSDKQDQPSNDNIGISSDVEESQQATTVHHLFPADLVSTSGSEHLGVAADESQISASLSIKDSDSSHSVIIQNSNATVSKESIQVIDSKMDLSTVGNQTDDVETHNQHVLQNTSALLSTPECIVSARSSSESLRQLSLQMNGLIEESFQASATHAEDNELERRNQELAAMLATEWQKREQLELQLKEYVSNYNMYQIFAT
jgi:hypothetical protein